MMKRFVRITALTLAVSSMAACTHNNNGFSYGEPNWTGGMEPADSNTGINPSASILPQTHLAAARLHEKQGAFDEAIRQYRRAIAVNHQYAEAYHGLGTLYARMGNSEEALSALQKASALAPKEPIIRNNLGYALLIQGRWTDAASEFEQATILKPSFARAHINRGLTLGKLQRFDEAMESFLAVLPPADAHYNIGLLHIAQGNQDKARVEFETSLSIDPQFAAASTRLSELNAVSQDNREEERLTLSTEAPPVVVEMPRAGETSESTVSTPTHDGELYASTVERRHASDPVQLDDQLLESHELEWVENDVENVTVSVPVVASLADDTSSDFNDLPCDEGELDSIDSFANDGGQKVSFDPSVPEVDQRVESGVIHPFATDRSGDLAPIEAEPIVDSPNTQIAVANELGDVEDDEPCEPEDEFPEVADYSSAVDDVVLIDPSLPLVDQIRTPEPTVEIVDDGPLYGDSLYGEYVMSSPDDLNSIVYGQDEYDPCLDTDAQYSFEEQASIVYEEIGIDPSAPLARYGSRRPTAPSNDAHLMGPRPGELLHSDSLGPVVVNNRSDREGVMGSGVDGPSDPALEGLEPIDWESALAELGELLPAVESDAPCSDLEDGIPPVTVALPDSSLQTESGHRTVSSNRKPIAPVRQPNSASKRIQAKYLVAARAARSTRRGDAILAIHATEIHANSSNGYVDSTTRLASIREEIDCWESVLTDVSDDEFLDVSFADAGAQVWAETAHGYAPRGGSVVQTARMTKHGSATRKTLDGSKPRTTMSMSVGSNSGSDSRTKASKRDQPSTADRLDNTRRGRNRNSGSSRTAQPYGRRSERQSENRDSGTRAEATPSPSPEMSVYDLMKFFSISSNEMRCWNAGDLQQFLRRPTGQSSEADLPSAIRASDTQEASKTKAKRSRRNRSRRDETTPHRYRIGRRSYDHTVKPARD